MKTPPTALALATLLLSGCAAFSGSTADPGGEVLDIGDLARSFWEVRDPPDTERRAQSLAIVEFTLEYVRPDVDAPLPRAGQSIKLELPDVLYASFVEALPSFHRRAVPIAAVTESETYGKLAGTGIAAIDLMTSDTSGVRFPAGGLISIDDEQPGRDELLARVAGEVAADAALQVRLRVSVRDGKASIEKGSSFRVVSDDGTAMVVSRRTLVSDTSVVAVSEDAGGAVDSSRFAAAVERLFRPYIGLALIASGRAVD